MDPPLAESSRNADCRSRGPAPLCLSRRGLASLASSSTAFQLDLSHCWPRFFVDRGLNGNPVGYLDSNRKWSSSASDSPPWKEGVHPKSAQSHATMAFQARRERLLISRLSHIRKCLPRVALIFFVQGTKVSRKSCCSGILFFLLSSSAWSQGPDKNDIFKNKTLGRSGVWPFTPLLTYFSRKVRCLSFMPFNLIWSFS